MQDTQPNPVWQMPLLAQSFAAARGVKVQPVVGPVDLSAGSRRVVLPKGLEPAA